jgi:hypothetical protein
MNQLHQQLIKNSSNFVKDKLSEGLLKSSHKRAFYGKDLIEYMQSQQIPKKQTKEELKAFIKHNFFNPE